MPLKLNISGASFENQISDGSYLSNILLFFFLSHVSCRKQMTFSYRRNLIILWNTKTLNCPFQGNFCFQGYAQCLLKVLGYTNCKSKDSLLSLGYAVFHQYSFFCSNPSVTFVFLIIYISVIDLQDISGFQCTLSELLTHHMGHWCEETYEQTGYKIATSHSL